MAITFDVKINRTAIAAEFLPGGQGYRWMDRVRLAMHAASVAAAPSRTNVLRASHRSYARGYGRNRVDVKIVNTAEHANWVHMGTAEKGTGFIYPEEADLLWVPIRKGGLSRTLRPRVRGQKPNPWLDRACTAVAIANGAVAYSG